MLSERIASEVRQAWKAVKVERFQFSTLVRTEWVFLLWPASLWVTAASDSLISVLGQGSARTTVGSAATEAFREAHPLCYYGKHWGSWLIPLSMLRYKNKSDLRKPYSQLGQFGRKNNNMKLKLNLWDPCFLESTWFPRNELECYTFGGWFKTKGTLEATLESTRSLPL